MSVAASKVSVREGQRGDLTATHSNVVAFDRSLGRDNIDREVHARTSWVAGELPPGQKWQCPYGGI